MQRPRSDRLVAAPSAAQAREHARWVAARNRFLGNLGLSFAVVLLMAVKVYHTRAWPLPLMLVAVSLLLVWRHRDFGEPHQARVVLSMLILLQALLYWEHVGPLLVGSLAGGSLLYVWRDQLGQHLARATSSASRLRHRDRPTSPRATSAAAGNHGTEEAVAHDTLKEGPRERGTTPSRRRARPKGGASR